MRKILSALILLCIFVSGKGQTISPTTATVCPGGSTTLTVGPLVPGTAVQWLQGPAYTPLSAFLNTYNVTTPGSYYVHVFGAVPSDTIGPVNVTLAPVPTAAFAFAPNTVQCGNKQYTFTSTSGSGLTYNWNFGDPSSNNNTSTSNPATHSFVGTPGNATQSIPVTLTVTNSSGCQSSITQQVTINQIPNATLTSTNGTVPFQGMTYFRACSLNPFLFTFNDATAPASNLNYQIIWGDGSPVYNSTTPPSALTHTYNVGNYILQYIVTGSNNCIDTTRYGVFVGSAPNGGIGTENPDLYKCTGATFTFPFLPSTFLNSAGTSYIITVDDGSPATTYTQATLPPAFVHTFNNTSCGIGTNSFFTVSILITNPCNIAGIPGSIGGIKISQTPEADFTITRDTLCINQSVTANDISLNEYVTEFGTCSPGKSVWSVTPGIQNVDWTISGTLGSTNSSSVPSGWTAGSASIQVQFLTPGNYSIALKTGGSDSCGIDEKIRTVCVNPVPTASFNASLTTGCAPLNVTTTSTSSAPFCGTNRYLWTVTPTSTTGCAPASPVVYLAGTNNTSAQPQFQFNSPGVYTIQLVVISPASACTSVVFTQTVTVKGKPVVDIDPFSSSVCIGTNVSPTASVTCNTTANSYAWTFQNGTPASASVNPPPAVVFNASGTSNISLAVTNECGTTTATEPVSVKDVTIANAGSSQTLCGNSVTMAANAAVVGTGTWTHVSGPAGYNIINPNSPTTQITGLTAGTYVFKWTINNAGCSTSANVTINISGGSTIANAGPDQDLCQATSATLAANNATVGTGTWSYISGPAGSTITNPALPGTTVTGLVTGVYVFRWTINYLNCTPSIDEVTITVSANPSAANAGTGQVICSSTTTLSGNIPATGTGTWTQVSGTPVTIANPALASTTINGLSAGTYEFKWTIANGTCPVSSNNVSITVTATPTTANAGSDQALCNVTSTNLAGNTPAAGSGTWSYVSGPAGYTIASPNLPTTPVTGLVPGTYVFRWSIGNGGCPTTNDDVEVVVSAPVTPSFAGNNQVVCGTSVSMSPGLPVVGQGIWSQFSGNPANIVNPMSPGTEINGLTPGVYVFTWTISNGACVSASNVTITISSGPTVSNAGPDQDLCLSTSATLAANTPVTGNGTWSQVSGPAAVITNNTLPGTTVTGLAVGTYTFRWSIAFSNCPASTDDVVVKIFDNPTVSAAGADQVICSSSATMAANTASIGTGGWTQTAGPGTATITNPASSTTQVNALVVGTYTFKWSISNGPCVVSEDAVLITVTDIPTTAQAGPDQFLCASTSASLSGNIAVSGTGTWTQTGGPAATITDPSQPATTVTGLLPGVYTFRWTIGNNVCAPNFDEVSITIYEAVTPSNAGTAQEVCGTSVTMSANTPLTGTGTWSQVSGAPATINAPTSPVSSISGLSPGNYVFAWTIVNGTCSSTSNVGIIISSGPTAADAGPDQDLCLATSATITGNTPSIGTGTWTFVSGPAGSTIADPLSASTTVSGLVPGVYIYKWTISFSNCTPTFDEVTITIFENPTISSAGTDQNICIPSAQLTANNPVIGSGMWSQVAGPGAALITDPTLPATSVSNLVGGSYQFVWTITSGPCIPSTDTVEIIYSTIANNLISGPSETCINTAPASIIGSLPSGSIGIYAYQWQQSIDGGLNWTDIPGATSIDYSPGVLVTSTCYRRLVTTAQCTGAQANPSLPLCVTVNPDARAVFSASSTILCAPVNIDTIISVTPFPAQNLQYNWYQNDILIPGTTNGLPPSHIITNDGATVVVKLVTTSPFGCKPDSMSITLNTRPAVIADFIKDTISGCGPLTVSFTNTSSILDNTIEFYWDFGNGITLSNVMQPPTAIIYQSSPEFRDTTYYITLKAFSGCDTTMKIDSIKVFANPKARFSTTTIGCSPFRDTIINSSLGFDAFTSYYWDFGDGTTDTTHSLGTLYHNYITGVVDTFTLRLIAENRCGRDTQSINVVVSPSYIQENITINGSELYGCAPHTVNFINSSTGAAFLDWDFGDGTPVETVPNLQSIVSHTYLSGGIFPVNITLRNACSDTTVQKLITVYAKPLASFTIQNPLICTGGTIITNNTSTDANSYEWFWGDNTSTAAFNASHTYAVAGTYLVRLVVRKINVFGIACTDTSAPVQITVVDRIPAVVNIDPSNNPCAPYTINVSAANAGAASQVDWYFYDSNTAPGIFHVTGSTASYVYNNPGVDSVKLVVENTAGCKDSTVRSFTIHKTPLAVFTPVNIKTCNTDTTATFSVDVNYTGTDPLQYQWFVNGVQVANSNPFTHRFQATPGVTATNIFDIKVLIRNSFGCGDTAHFGVFIIQTLSQQGITVSPSLVQDQPNSTFTFTDTSLTTPNIRYEWYTGDRNGTILPGNPITHTYGDTGVYHVKLITTDFETGCFVRDSITVSVLYIPGYLYVPNAFCPACHKLELRQFLPLGKGLKDYHLTVFNIWGQKVFETRSLDANGVPNEPWTGNLNNGSNAQQGAFSWVIEAHYKNGTEWKGMLDPKTNRLEKHGFISIIR